MAVYANKLRELIDNPGAFAGSTGFKFALDQGLGAINASNSRQRGSGNVLAALTKYGAGLAQQDYGNEFDRLLRATGEEDQNALGMETNRLTGLRDANALTLGTRAADTADKRVGYDYALGTRAADTADKKVGYDYTLGGRAADTADARVASDFTLGTGQLANTRRAGDQNFGVNMYRAGNDAQNNWWNYDVNRRQVDNTAANNENRFNLDAARLPIDWFNARTNRGQAESQDWWNPQRQARMPLTRRIV